MGTSFRTAAALAFALLAGCSSTIAPPGALPDGGACSQGTLTFLLQAAIPSDFCIGPPSGCVLRWVTVVGPDGVEHVLDPPCLPDCATCAPAACPASCAVPSPVPAAGIRRTWDGTWSTPGTCGAAQSCNAHGCAVPGHYTARMCAYHSVRPSDPPPSACMADRTSTCVDVPFDWPPASAGSTVTGTLGGAPDAGTIDVPSADVADADAADAGGCRLPNGNWCPAGRSCPAGDGCNVCMCRGGAAECTGLFCPTDAGHPDVCLIDCPAPPPGCHYVGPVTCSPPSCGTLVCPDAGPAACSPACGPSRTCCGGRCVNTANDPVNCGGCGNACAGSTPYCNGSGRCEATPCMHDPGACAAGTTCCGNQCCTAGQICCEPQGPVSFGPQCLTPTGSPPTCPPGCAPLCISDRNVKRDIVPVNDEDVLARVSRLPVSEWSYQWDPASTRHMGPMAQDFYAAFGLGDTDRAYNAIDAHGVAFAAIRGLVQRLDAQAARIDRLEAENARLRGGRRANRGR